MSFAACDPTTGAGLQADLLTLAALGCHALTIVTAITAQDTHGVSAVKALPPEWVHEQIQGLGDDFSLAAVKIGLLGDGGSAGVVADWLKNHPEIPVVLDPVLASGRGDCLVDPDVLAILRTRLMPQAYVITPNTLEAAQLTGGLRPLVSEAEINRCAQALMHQYACAHVLITGTHSAELDADMSAESGVEGAPSQTVTHRLYARTSSVPIHRLSCPRLPGQYHGSGCTLASAIAAGLAQGLAILEAVERAQAYTWRTLAAAYAPGRGQAIPDRLLAWRAHA